MNAPIKDQILAALGEQYATWDDKSLLLLFLYQFNEEGLKAEFEQSVVNWVKSGGKAEQKPRAPHLPLLYFQVKAELLTLVREAPLVEVLQKDFASQSVEILYKTILYETSKRLSHRDFDKRF